MKPSIRLSIPVVLLAVAALSGCGKEAPSITAPGAGPVAGATIDTGEGPFGGQTVAWYEAQLNQYTKTRPDNPAWQEALWCSGVDAQGNTVISADEIQKRRGTPSCQNFYKAADLAQGPFAGHDHAWFKAHPKERGEQTAWCNALGKGGLGTTGTCAAVQTTGAGFY